MPRLEKGTYLQPPRQAALLPLGQRKNEAGRTGLPQDVLVPQQQN